MIIVSAARPNNRPPAAGGPPLESGDIWHHSMTGARQRYDGAAWAPYAPETIVSTGAPSLRANGSSLQYGDIWVHTNTAAQAYWAGANWAVIEAPAGIVPVAGRDTDHLAKGSDRSFDMRWVDPTDGTVWLHEQRTAAQVWFVQHNMRCTYVAVTVVDDSQTPQVLMIPDIAYAENQCELRFASAVSGFAVIHASKRNPDAIVL